MRRQCNRCMTLWRMCACACKGVCHVCTCHWHFCTPARFRSSAAAACRAELLRVSAEALAHMSGLRGSLSRASGRELSKRSAMPCGQNTRNEACRMSFSRRKGSQQRSWGDLRTFGGSTFGNFCGPCFGPSFILVPGGGGVER